MFNRVLLIGYFVGVVMEIKIRIPYAKSIKQNKIVDDCQRTQEKSLFWILATGMIFIPLLYALTTLFHFADYELPIGVSLIGVMIFILSLGLFWRSHIDLDRNWSPLLQIRENHALITTGVYKYIRHPMYASMWLWVIAQPLLLHNWIAGWAGLITFLPLYVLRVPREEEMMMDHFGEVYRLYMKRTGRILPRIRG